MALWKETRRSWRAAWREPARSLRILYLILGLFIAHAIAPVAFSQLGTMGGVSYLFAVLMALLDATFFRAVRVGRFKYVPLGLTAPFLILVGVAASLAIRPLLGDAKNAALAEDFVGSGHHPGRVRPADAVVPAMAEREPVLTLT